ncbi:DNA-binding GntR family transcriptional regulator [Palleronia aestuarii]|uniref:DNA-binding GntR family transcriptional regulator n=1 Tax=Palleronia aestuarii TaxID=568105 RepID=A0A2W7NAN6_9RHOB|nr:GntR family transcriptional regulator [Palleronia aestuarii]PZX17148.1 DNA-binding GntR family transcriptional regulator [Palleronia aestuarii]
MSSRVNKVGDRSSNAGDWVRPVGRESLAEQAYASIREALMRGQLAPGERMRLRPMSEKFGISLTPMREALLRLVVEKAMDLDGRGTVIVPTLSLDQLLEIRAIRMDLEGRLAASAARMAMPDEIDNLERIQARIAVCHAERRFDDAIPLNTEFHLALCAAGRLPITYEIVEGLWVRCGPILSHLYDAGEPPGWDPHPHMRVIEGLRRGDEEAARDGIRYDIEMGGRGLLEHVRQS